MARVYNALHSLYRHPNIKGPACGSNLQREPASKATMRRAECLVCLLAAWAELVGPASAAAQSALAGDTLRITRAPGSIAVDGDLSDEGWRGALRVDTWYEVNPGDNTQPKVRNVGYLTYDEVNDALPPEMVTSDQIDDLMVLLSQRSIEVVVAPSQATLHKEQKRQAAAQTCQLCAAAWRRCARPSLHRYLERSRAA